MLADTGRLEALSGEPRFAPFLPVLTGADPEALQQLLRQAVQVGERQSAGSRLL